MIYTESTAYLERAGKLTPVSGRRLFITAPDIETVRGLLRAEIDPRIEVPVLFITRQMPGSQPATPANDFPI